MRSRPLLLLLSLSLLVPLPSFAAAAAPPSHGGAERAYVKALHDRIHPRWDSFLLELSRLGPPYQDATLSVDLVLVFDETGALRGIEHQRHAQLKGFDDAPADVVRDLGRLPPPPILRSDDGRIYVRWRFLRRRPGCEEGQVLHRRLPIREAVVLLSAGGRGDEAVARVRAELPEATAERRTLLLSLCEALGRAAARSPEIDQRKAAAAILSHIRGAEPELLALLADPDPAVRKSALPALFSQKLSPAARRPLHDLLTTEDRATAAQLLSRLGDRSAIPVLREALAAGKQPAETAAALRTLGDAAEASRITALLLKESPTWLAGALSARALSDPGLSRALCARFDGAEEDLRVAILDALAALGPRAPAEARRLIVQSLSAPGLLLRQHALVATAGLSDHSLALQYRLMDAALVDPEPVVRAAAGAALVQVGAEQAKDELIRVGRDPEEIVRVTLLQALLSHPYPSGKLLIAKLRKDPAVAQQAMRPGGGGPRGQLLISSRLLTLPAAAHEEQALTDRLLDPAARLGRLRAAADYVAQVLVTVPGRALGPDRVQ